MATKLQTPTEKFMWDTIGVPILADARLKAKVRVFINYMNEKQMPANYILLYPDINDDPDQSADNVTVSRVSNSMVSIVGQGTLDDCLVNRMTAKVETLLTNAGVQYKTKNHGYDPNTDTTRKTITFKHFKKGGN